MIKKGPPPNSAKKMRYQKGRNKLQLQGACAYKTIKMKKMTKNKKGS